MKRAASYKPKISKKRMTAGQLDMMEKLNQAYTPGYWVVGAIHEDFCNFKQYFGVCNCNYVVLYQKNPKECTMSDNPPNGIVVPDDYYPGSGITP